ncbi:hypothetical protein PIB30_022105 [Stylosanthes scabra]|uniref:Uncharacterized protein n=1 Tax=Stylosanthes scabra TaxID=79078 RepID=A0ABU6S944_9FABA|nr:hypothetical protein [Stylosanthes scabra]
MPSRRGHHGAAMASDLIAAWLETSDPPPLRDLHRSATTSSSEFCVGLHPPTTTLSTSSAPLIGRIMLATEKTSSMAEGVAPVEQWWKVSGSGGSA